MNLTQKPAPSEYPPYFETYLKRLPDTDILQLLAAQAETLADLFQNVEETDAEKGYAEGKWSLKELLQHMLDTERILAYRALCFSRKEIALLPGFDEDTYVANSEANRRSLSEILTEYSLVRQTTIALFKSFSPEMLLREGKANHAQFNVGSIAWIIAGHENHHLEVIRTRYLTAAVL